MIKTDHSGAKNGGGAWCKRAEAKAESNSQRRSEDRNLAREAIQNDTSAPDRKCIDCGGDGVVPMINRDGYQCGTARCPTCGGTRYAP